MSQDTREFIANYLHKQWVAMLPYQQNVPQPLGHSRWAYWCHTPILVCWSIFISVLLLILYFFSFYSLVLWEPDLRLWALIVYISNSVSFLCSQMCLQSCSLSLNKKDVCTAGWHILIYLGPEMWRMKWPDGHYLNPMWLQIFWSSGGDNWPTKPTLKFIFLSYRLQIKSPVTFLT